MRVGSNGGCSRDRSRDVRTIGYSLSIVFSSETGKKWLPVICVYVVCICAYVHMCTPSNIRVLICGISLTNILVLIVGRNI